MKEALRQAKKAEKLGEVPIGCVIVQDGKIIARGYNRRNTDKKYTCTCRTSGDSKGQQGSGRLAAGGMYHVHYTGTLSDVRGAIVQARIPRVVIGCRNPKGRMCRFDPESS